jgi:allantoinase
MPLPDDYLTYPHRAYGMDQGRYPWRPAPARTPIAWPESKTLAVMIVVPLEFFPLNPSGKPFKHPGAMVTPYPDLRHFTSRDYGNRIGAFRLLDALKAAGIKATFPVNAVLLEPIRPLIDAILADGHEIAAHGLSTDHIHCGGMEPDTEQAIINETRERFAKAGLNPRGWMSPARQQSFQTLDIIKAAGFDWHLDWEADTVPLPMATQHGPILSLPLSNELDDRTLLIDRRQSEDEWAGQILEAASFLKAEAPKAGGQMLGFTLTPYVTGLPFRIAPLRKVLQALGSDNDTWCTTGSAIVDAFAP